MKLENEDKTNETKGMLYEAYLNRGLRFDRRKRRASKMELLNLINAENGKGFKFHGSAAKQLKEIKVRLANATKLMIKHLDLDNVNEQALYKFLEELQSANNSEDVVKLVDEALYFTQENK
ncbi:hypothetical protein N7U66_16770 [Lacinutrix neustonica]|uniref:Uncharacterized protein n=1 Tax=Lacinutrix neustonica TaxID=2980107 RepID=A0A9E8MVA7_9FLAO|nr:hypothetical protein [Lacinutrix neustonica]WAC01584.1 hypothetical protein N7U66_16770 [Lacinutrix neustonica]|tara:strand:- start:509 stop:871 length:363 start_codon:yes stop_codon:yes gene_type:complete